MANTYKFSTHLCGFVSVARDQGKFNNRSFAYQIPKDVLQQIETDRAELLKWASSISKHKPTQTAMSPWDEEGICKYTYGAGNGDRKAKPEPQWFGVDGIELNQDALEAVTGGTPVEITATQRPYAMQKNIGTSLRVEKLQLIREEREPELIAVDDAAAANKEEQCSFVETMPYFKRSLADVIGSGVVFGLQDILDTYIPVVGPDHIDDLVELVRQEANQYLDQERRS